MHLLGLMLLFGIWYKEVMLSVVKGQHGQVLGVDGVIIS